MDVSRIAVCVILSIPAGYLIGLLVDRIPDALPLGKDLPAPRFTGKYLLAHLLAAITFGLAGLRLSEEPWTFLIPMLVFLTSAIALSLIDLETLRLPDRLVAPTFLVLLALITIIDVIEQQANLIRYALLGSLIFFGFLFVFHLIFGNRGLGFGDVKAAAILGLMLGWISDPEPIHVLVLVIWAVLIAFTLSAVLGFALWIGRGRSRSYPIGPFLVFGTCATMFFSHPILFT